MAKENEYIRTLIAARVRELGHRREAAKALAKDYAPGDSEYMRETFVKIQETIEAIERAIADPLRLADLRVPVLIQATPDDPKNMTIASRRDSFCGKMSACNNLAQYGIPYSLTTLHTESPSSDVFMKDLKWFESVCRIVRGLKNLRIGSIGARPAPHGDHASTCTRPVIQFFCPVSTRISRRPFNFGTAPRCRLAM